MLQTDMKRAICESLAETTGNVISLYVYQPVIYVVFFVCWLVGCTVVIETPSWDIPRVLLTDFF